MKNALHLLCVDKVMSEAGSEDNFEPRPFEGHVENLLKNSEGASRTYFN
jgi:hypothetical protein